jgi:hypothetical protein
MVKVRTLKERYLLYNFTPCNIFFKNPIDENENLPEYPKVLIN